MKSSVIHSNLESHRPVEPKLIRLNKLMAHRGLCSRREADSLIAAGQVMVDGQDAAQLGSKVAENVKITLASAGQATLNTKWVAVLNKPRGYVSQLPEGDQRDAHELLSPERYWQSASVPPPDFDPPDIHSSAVAGRLDRSSRGLLIFSTDGRVVREITQGGRWSKKYLITCTTEVAPGQVKELNDMRSLGQWKLKPMCVSSLGGRRLRFELREGKKHQIREVCHAVGLDVSDLYRVAVGPLELGAMPEGRWRLLSSQEISEILDSNRLHNKTREKSR